MPDRFNRLLLGFCALGIGGWGLAASAADTAEYGDRVPGFNYRLPPMAFHANGGRVYDIVADFGAIPDDGKDDTAAFQRAYDMVMAKVEPTAEKPFVEGDPGEADANTIIYIPSGVYDLSDTAIYSGNVIRVQGKSKSPDGRHNSIDLIRPGDKIAPGTHEMLSKIRLVGESRERTIIRLRDSAAGFGDPLTPKPVISFGKIRTNNIVAYNEVRNLTVDVGKGNPGAIGILFGGANNAGIHNVTVRSAKDSGAVGIMLGINPAIPLVQDVTVEGFAIGVWAAQVNNLPMQAILDRVTLRNQRNVGARFDGLHVSAARLKVEGTPLPIEVRHPDANVVLISSFLSGSDPKQPAIALRDGFLLGRSIKTRGVRSMIAGGKSLSVTRNNASEFLANVGPALRPIAGRDHGGRLSTLNLALRDPGVMPDNLSAYPDFARDWAAPEDFDPRAGEPGYDSTAAVRAAFASGKPVIYFPKASYLISNTISVPATVKNIQFLYSRFVSSQTSTKNAFLRIDAPSQTPLALQQYQGGERTWMLMEQTAWRPIVMQHVGNKTTTYANRLFDGPPVPLYLDSVNGFGKEADAFRNTISTIIALNTESKSSIDFTVPSSSVMWVLGFKTEGTVPLFRVERGGTLEILGGVANQFGHHGSPPSLRYGKCPDPAQKIACFGAIQNYGGNVSISLASTRTGPATFTPIIIEDGAEGSANPIGRQALPDRPSPVGASGFSNFRIPLYVSYR